MLIFQSDISIMAKIFADKMLYKYGRKNFKMTEALRTQKCLFLFLVLCSQVCLPLEAPRSSMATSTLQLEATLMILAQGFFVP